MAVAVLAATVALMPQVVSVPDGAEAATPVHADADVVNACNGEMPCYTTIQEAVNNAGPAPAQVRIFPGTYAESVNLSLMGSAIAGTPGDIELIAVDSANSPTNSGVLVQPPGAGHGIHHTVVPFPGEVVIRGVDSTSIDGSGVQILTDDDPITVEGVTVENADFRGVELHSVTGDLSIASSVVDASFDDGFRLETGGSIAINSSTADNSVFGDGFDVRSLGGQITITNSTAADNAAAGFYVETAGDVEITNISAIGNDDDGLHMHAVAASSVVIASSNFNLNLNDGLEIIDNGHETAVVVVSTEASSNGGDGFDVDGLLNLGSSIVMTLVTVNQNSEDGIDTAPDIDVFVMCSTITNNGSRGIDVSSGGVAAGTFNFNNISGNGTGVRNNSAGTADAQHNWWGAADGPGPVGPGTGDPVTAGVDFTPFLTAPVDLQDCPPENGELPTPTATVPGEDTATPPPAQPTATPTPTDIEGPTATPAPVEPEPTPTVVDADLDPVITAPVAGSGPLGGMSGAGMLALAAGIAGLAVAAAGVSLRSRMRRVRA